MSKKIELSLIKTAEGITATNKEESTIDMFDDDDEGRKSFVEYMIENFINKEVENGRKYK